MKLLQIHGVWWGGEGGADKCSGGLGAGGRRWLDEVFEGLHRRHPANLRTQAVPLTDGEQVEPYVCMMFCRKENGRWQGGTSSNENVTICGTGERMDGS